MALAAALAVWVPPEPSAAATVVAGVCTLDLELSRTEVVDLDLATPIWTVDGGGSCVVPGHGLELAASIDGTLTAVGAANCGIGVYLGELSFGIPGVLGEVEADVAVAAMAGPVLHATMVAVPRLAGTGVFVDMQDGEPGVATAACATGGVATTRWMGVFAFGDPEV